MLADMAIPANWLIAPSKTELLWIDAPTLTEWQAKIAQVLEKTAGH
jgi:hypothetical protein